MDHSSSYYSKLTRILLSLFGLWPSQKSVARYTLVMIFGTVLFSGVAVQLTTFCTKTYSTELLLKVLSYSGAWFNYTTKYISFALNINGVGNLVQQIQHDWNTVESEVEKKIMQQYASMGRTITLISSRVTIISVGGFVVLQFMPDIIDFVAPLNESRSHNLPVMVEYFVDQEKYFCVILLHLTAVALTGLLVIVATESITLLCTLHICARYEIVRYRIQRALDENYLRKCIVHNTVAKVYEEMISGIQIHMQTLESLPIFCEFVIVILNPFVYQRYCSLVRSTLLSTYIIPLPLGVLTLSLHLYRISMITSLDDFEEFVITAVFILAHFGYFFFGNCIMQIIVDCTTMIFPQVYNTDWYAAPLKIQKIVLHLLQRSIMSPNITIMGLYAPSLEGFIKNSEISLFETNIRFMGSLLACYALTGDVMFRDKAAQLGERMLPAFQTETGIPHSLINLHTGASKNYGWASSGCSILSEIGTMHLEFTYLSDITGNPVFKSKVENVRKVLKNLEKPKGLYPNYIHPRTGKWGQHHMSLGGLGDSFYEYLLKAWIQSGKEDTEAREMYDEAISAINQHMIKTSPGKLLYVSDLKYDRPEHKMGHLACFAGGMFALGAKTLQNELSERYMTVAAGLTNTCHESYDRSFTKLGPEAFHFIEGNEAKSLKNGEKYYILRPETFESYFVMWRLTKDPKYREWGWEAVQALEKYCRVPGGFTGLHNVYLLEPPKDDVQQSYFFAETLKYLYLLFSDDDLINLDEWVFNSEAHVLPIRGNPLYRQAPSL